MKLLLILLFLSTSVHAEYHENPYDMFSTDKNFTSSSSVTWIPVDNVQSVCDKLRVKSTGKPFPYKILACSEWKQNFIFKSECRVYTSRNVNLTTIGHEIRHCFQGDFHK